MVYKAFFKESFILSNSRHSSYLYDLLGPKVNAVGSILDKFLFLVSNIFISISIIFALINVSPRLTFYGILVISLIYGTLIKIIRPTIINNSKVQSKLSSECAKLATDSSLGLRDITLRDKFNEIISRYLDFDIKLRRTVVLNDFLSFFPKYTLEFLVLSLFPLIIIFQNLFRFNELPIALLAAFILALQKLLPSFQTIYISYNIINQNIFALRAIKDSLKPIKRDPSSSIELAENHNEIKDKLIEFKSLNFKDVSFKYSKSNNFTIRNLSFEISSGDIVLLDGPSGSGKSTTIDLISGLLQPSSGDIVLNNTSFVNSKNIRFIKSWRYSLSYVSQNPYFLSSSIAKIISSTEISGCFDENLIFGIIKNRMPR